MAAQLRKSASSTYGAARLRILLQLFITSVICHRKPVALGVAHLGAHVLVDGAEEVRLDHLLTQVDQLGVHVLRAETAPRWCRDGAEIGLSRQVSPPRSAQALELPILEALSTCAPSPLMLARSAIVLRRRAKAA